MGKEISRKVEITGIDTLNSVCLVQFQRYCQRYSLDILRLNDIRWLAHWSHSFPRFRIRNILIVKCYVPTETFDLEKVVCYEDINIVQCPFVDCNDNGETFGFSVVSTASSLVTHCPNAESAIW